jgi:hypothetical protein
VREERSDAAASKSSAPDDAKISPAPVSLPVAARVGTARMYMAHAPLRVPAVADPDSEENRRILETMVRKALAENATSASRTP